MEHKGKQNNAYLEFKDLSDDDKDLLILYEEKTAKMLGKYNTEFDAKCIKNKYGNCVFPPFVLNMMRLVVKYH